jgi:hypothetical protein
MLNCNAGVFSIFGMPSESSGVTTFEDFSALTGLTAQCTMYAQGVEYMSQKANGSNLTKTAANSFRFSAQMKATLSSNVITITGSGTY